MQGFLYLWIWLSEGNNEVYDHMCKIIAEMCALFKNPGLLLLHPIHST